MKPLKIISALLLFFALGSCCSIRVAADYDKNVDFTPFKTYAFYKNGIDKVDISDLDKKRNPSGNRRGHGFERIHQKRHS